MSHPSSFIWSSWKQDRGRKTLSMPAAYERTQEGGDYLIDSRPESEKRTFPIGKSSGRDRKFKVGFYRRPLDKIQPFHQREQWEEKKQQRMDDAMMKRREQLMTLQGKNGNIISHQYSGETETNRNSNLNGNGNNGLYHQGNNNNEYNGNVSSTGPLSPPFASSRRHIPLLRHQEYVAKESYIRGKESNNRFHLIPTVHEQERMRMKQEAELARQKQGCSIVGYGRNELSTYGVADVLNGWEKNRYTEQDLVKYQKQNHQRANANSDSTVPVSRPTRSIYSQSQSHFVIGSQRDAQQSSALAEFHREVEKRQLRGGKHLESQIAFAFRDPLADQPKKYIMNPAEMRRGNENNCTATASSTAPVTVAVTVPAAASSSGESS